ncbi:hypothetical protein MJ391_10170 [Escherichia coli]|nr:hypothetical protein MJ391_10170 [Escherichia coli]
MQKGTTTLRNIYITGVLKRPIAQFAMATELRKVGAEVEEGHDYIRNYPTGKTEFCRDQHIQMITGRRCVSQAGGVVRYTSDDS